MKTLFKGKSIFLIALALIIAWSGNCFAKIPVYRLYNTVSKTHLYTADANEKAVLEAYPDWNYEGVVWKGYESHAGQKPVYRLYSPGLGRHLFTMDENEKNVLAAGPVWQFEQIAWYANVTPSFGDISVFRLYSDELKQHLFTADVNEKNILHGNGVWVYESTAFYAADALDDDDDDSNKDDDDDSNKDDDDDSSIKDDDDDSSIPPDQNTTTDDDDDSSNTSDENGISSKSEINLDVVRVEACEGKCSVVGGAMQVNLVDGKIIFPDQTVLLPGDTKELRLILGNDSTITINGESFPLTVPSGQTSGLKLKGQKTFPQEGGFLSSISLEFSFDKSIVVHGNSYSLKPVLQVLSAEVTSLPENMATVVARPDEETVLTIGDDFSLLIPAGAVSEHTLITSEEIKNYIEILDPSTQGLLIKPDLASTFKLGPEGIAFHEPLQIRLKYNIDALRDKFTEEDLTIRHDGHKVETILDSQSQTVTGYIDHFSKVTISTYSGECTEEIVSQFAEGAPIKYFDCEKAHGYPRMHVAVADRVALEDTHELRILAHDSENQNGKFRTQQVEHLAKDHVPEPVIAINGNTFACEEKDCYSGRDGSYPTRTTVMNGVLKQLVKNPNDVLEVTMSFGGPPARDRIPIQYLVVVQWRVIKFIQALNRIHIYRISL